MKEVMVVKRIIIISVFMFILLANSSLQTEVNKQIEPIMLKSREIVPKTHFFYNIESGKHYIIQLENIPSNEEKMEMEANGLLLLDYIPERAWTAKISNVTALYDYGILHIEKILPEDKVSSQINLNSDNWKIKKIKVLFFDDVDGKSAEETLEKYGEITEKSSSSFIVKISENRIKKLAMEDGVKWIEMEKKPMLLNDGARAVCSVDAIHTSPYNLTGAGVTLAMWDGGLANHSDFNSRRIIGNDISENGHATHVAGTMAGNGNLSQSKGGAALQWKGMAPNATIVSYYFWPQSDTYVEINESIANYGAVLSQNSWGWNVHSNCSQLGDYDSDSQEYDKIVRGMNTAGPISVVFSAGNERSAGQDEYGAYYCGAASQGNHTYNTTIGPGGTAKNTITVGAVNKSKNMTSYSSWGPTDDGRIKPDVVAVGDNVKSTYIGETYSTLSGTSMAAPVVSGILALMVEEFRNTHSNNNPSPAYLKAVLIHTAKDLENIGPDFKTGWGLVNATAAVNKIIEDKNYSGIVKNGSLNNGENNTYTINVSANFSQLKITLVWSDYPGTPNAAKELVNNLDLWVEDSIGNKFYPWVLNLSNFTQPAATGIDSINNIEQVSINNLSAGTYTVVVNATSVPQAPQNYSLVFDDLDNPLWSGNKTSPESGVVFQNQSYQFNITWTDSFTIDVVLFEFNGTNYTANKNRNEYYYNLFNLSIGNYTYRWYANDTTGNSNQTDTFIYAVKPPDIFVNLISPENNSFTNNQTVYFRFNASRVTDSVLNCSLYLNNMLNQTNETVPLNTEIIFNSSLSEGIYEWYVNCTNNSVANVSETWFFIVDRTKPEISISSPAGIYNVLVLNLNYSVNETYPDSCWYEYNGVNTSLVNCSNTSFTALDDQESVLILYANDSAGNIKSSNVSFSVYTPDLNYILTIGNFSDTEINVSINITNLNISEFNLSIDIADSITGFNVTNNSMELNVTGNSTHKVINTTGFDNIIVSYKVNITQINQSNPSFNLGSSAFDLDYGMIAGKSSFFYPSNTAINLSILLNLNVSENWIVVAPFNHTNNTYNIGSNRELKSIIAIGNLIVNSSLINETNITWAYPANASRTYQNNTYYYENLAGETPNFSATNYAPSYYSVYVNIFNETINNRLLVFYPLFVGKDVGGNVEGYSIYVTPYSIQHLTSHEIFHLWNGEIFKPNSSSENWFKEGVTEYYSCLARHRAGVYNRKQYYNCLKSWYDIFVNITEANSSLNVSLIEAGKNDNGGVVGEANYRTLYHAKGAAVTYLWNKNISTITGQNKSFDDVMLYIYQNFRNSRYSSTDILDAANNVTNLTGNFSAFFNDFVNGTKNMIEAADDFADNDSDGLANALEVELGTDPNNADTDGDGIIDGDEYDAGTDPLTAPSIETGGGGLIFYIPVTTEAVAICNESDLKCEGNVSYICLNNSWEISEECIYGCRNGTCGERPKICMENKLRCSGLYLEKCVDGYEWVIVETCDYKCENTACIEKPGSRLSKPVGAFFGLGTETWSFLVAVVIVIIIVSVWFLKMK